MKLATSEHPWGRIVLLLLISSVSQAVQSRVNTFLLGYVGSDPALLRQMD